MSIVSKEGVGISQFSEAVSQMNSMYKLPNYTGPGFQNDIGWSQRQAICIKHFHTTLVDEVNELNDIVNTIEAVPGKSPLQVLTDLADLLGDVVVYCFSEAKKYDIPLEQVLTVIMLSNASKLGSNGNPIYNEQGKFLKGPDYFRPEPLIFELLEEHYSKKSSGREE